LNTTKKTVDFIGFKALLAWHYLILFSDLLIGDFGETTHDFFFLRQMVLYVSLAFGFTISLLVDRFLRKRKTRKPAYGFLAVVGVVSFVSTTLGVMFIPLQNVVLSLALTVCIGITQTFLMFLWLQFCLVETEGEIRRSFPVDMIYGAAVGFVACVLQPPYSFIVVAILPAIASISLFAKWKLSCFPYECFQTPRKQEPAALEKKGLSKIFLSTLLPTMVFAFVFGMLQGSYFQHGEPFMIATNPLIILGIVICGIMLLSLPKKPESSVEVDIKYRLSMLFFVLGILGLALFRDKLTVVSEALILTGFNLFDFGAMVLSLNIIRLLKLNNSGFVIAGRIFTYLSLAIGLGVGLFVMESVAEESSVLLYSISGFAIALLIVTSFVPFRKLEELSASSKKTEKGNGEVPCCARENEASRVDHSVSAIKKPPKKTALTERPSGVAKTLKVEQTQESDLLKPQSIWKNSCFEVAKLYRLSPRETEIFFLIAKGRNAEYVQQQLYISTHTAKTHIANIYHKLGVHSSQEMLNLIELFKTQKKEGEKATSSSSIPS